MDKAKKGGPVRVSPVERRPPSKGHSDEEHPSPAESFQRVVDRALGIGRKEEPGIEGEIGTPAEEK